MTDGRRQALLSSIAPLCLVVLALVQIALVHAIDLSPWKGGGFGMFSTNDHGGFRVVRAFRLEDGAATPLRIPDALRREALRAREVPTEARLARLARRLADRASPREGGAVRVTVQRLEFDAELVPALRELASVTVGAAP